MTNVHADIPEFSAFVRSEFLYDMDPAYEGQTEPCTVFAVSSYKGHYPTFKILLKNGSLFDYIPAHALLVGRTKAPHGSMTLDELCFSKTCPDHSITVNAHTVLAGKFAENICWIPQRKVFVEVDRYICTVDWYLSNQNAHLVVLAHGQVAFVPNHKVLFLAKPTDEVKLQPYRRLRQEWKP